MANVYGNNAGNWIDIFDGVTNGADNIYGYGGDDFIFAMGGNDVITGGAGGDYIDGGTGNDTASYADSATGVTVNLSTGWGYGGTAEGDELVHVENLTGSWYADWLIGDEGNNVLAGLGGDDILSGGEGNDTLYGDSGNDVLKGGGGADQLNGGSGIDTANYYDSGAGIFVWLGGDVAADGDAEGDDLNSIENVTGSNYADDLWGGDGANVLRGNGGNDNLKGFGGADSLFGGDGNDHLDGGDGADMLTGGLGADTFTWATAEGNFISADSMDKVMDFNAAQGDVIDVHQMDANTTLGGNQAFSFIGYFDAANGFTAAGQVGYTYFEGNTYLLFNTDNIFVDGAGHTDSEHVIRIEGIVAPDASWFDL